jgi:hypothetical protein
MASFNIHLAVAKAYLAKHYEIKDATAFFEGSIAPDLTSPKSISHRRESATEENWRRLLINNCDIAGMLPELDLQNDFDRGRLLHLITDEEFYTTMFDKTMTDNCMHCIFASNLTYSYDALDDQLARDFDLSEIKLSRKAEMTAGIADYQAKMQHHFEGNTRAPENILPKDKLYQFIDRMSNINLEDYIARFKK